MPYNHRNFKRCIIILTLAVLSLGVGGKANLCFMPDGEVHLEQSHFACGLDGGSLAPGGAMALGADRVGGHCLDVSLGGAASNYHHGNMVSPQVPALIPLGPPNIFAQTGRIPSPNIPAVPPPHLLSLQSVVLLI